MKTVLELDLAGYSDIARELEENIGVAVVASFNEQIHTFVDAALDAVGAKRDQVVMATTGDGAILTFDEAQVAHRFAQAVHDAAQARNMKVTSVSAQRWFRIGAATGEIIQRRKTKGGFEIAGTTIANAVQFEHAAQIGQFLIDVTTYDALPTDLQQQYESEEEIKGKRQEKFRARRCIMIPTPINTTNEINVFTILDIYDRINDVVLQSKLRIITTAIGMPFGTLPGPESSLDDKKGAILAWADGEKGGLKKLAEALKRFTNPP